jgi:hypothetical protein
VIDSARKFGWAQVDTIYQLPGSLSFNAIISIASSSQTVILNIDKNRNEFPNAPCTHFLYNTYVLVIHWLLLLIWTGCWIVNYAKTEEQE